MLTDRQRETYKFIRDYCVRTGYAPKLSEIAHGIGIHSKGVVHRHLQAIADAGLIERLPGRHRGIRLCGDLSEREVAGFTLPLVGTIAAGEPIEAIPNQQPFDLTEFFMGPDRFLLRVRGDSMIDAGILDGDMVIVEKRDQGDDGDIVVALIDDNEATLKYLSKNGDGRITLIPANEALQHTSYPAERIRIQGVVVGQMRSYL